MPVIVVVGAGLAGLQTVVALRAQGYAGALTLLGSERDGRYGPYRKCLACSRNVAQRHYE